VGSNPTSSASATNALAERDDGGSAGGPPVTRSLVGKRLTLPT
jgi:hypothetical protein